MDFADAILADADVNSQEVAEPAASGAPGAPVADPCDGGRLLQLAPASPAAGGGEDDLGQSVASAGGRGRGRGRGRGQGATRRYTLQEISAKARAARAGAALKRVRSEALQEMALQANEVNRHGNLRAGVEMKVWKGKSGPARLQLVKRAVRGQGRWQMMSAHGRLDMAFSTEQRVRVLGRQFRQHAKTVSANRLVVANCFLKQQTKYLEFLHAMCCTREPHCVSIGWKWDEATENLTVQCGAQECSDSWDVLVSSCRLVVAWPDRPLVVVDLVRPPAPLPSNSSSSILAGLRHHPAVVDMEVLLEKIRRSARERIGVT